MNRNFVLEIGYLLEKVPSAIWEDPWICGLMYDFLPWHKMSSIAIQTKNDDRYDFGAWKYYDCASSDASRIRDELARYAGGDGRRVYHELLIEAAEALLSVDFARYGQPNTIDDFRLYGPFRLQVYDADETFRFNY